jgi:hypothetical protein
VRPPAGGEGRCRLSGADVAEAMPVLFYAGLAVLMVAAAVAGSGGRRRK